MFNDKPKWEQPDNVKKSEPTEAGELAKKHGIFARPRADAHRPVRARSEAIDGSSPGVEGQSAKIGRSWPARARHKLEWPSSSRWRHLSAATASAASSRASSVSMSAVREDDTAHVSLPHFGEIRGTTAGFTCSNLSGAFGSRQIRFHHKQWRDSFLSILSDQAPRCRITRWRQSNTRRAFWLPCATQQASNMDCKRVSPATYRSTGAGVGHVGDHKADGDRERRPNVATSGKQHRHGHGPRA